ncbi:MAG: hypothetical protein ABIH50_06650 [bacterium]
MSYYRNYIGNSATMPKPRRPMKVDNPDLARVYQHNSESRRSFKSIGADINFLMEAMKFFSPEERAAYSGDTTAEQDWSQFWGETDPGGATAKPWGAGAGETGKNLEFSSGIADFNHFIVEADDRYRGSDQKAYDLIANTNPDKPFGYEDDTLGFLPLGQLSQQLKDYGRMFGIDPVDYAKIWRGVSDRANANYGVKNFYDIVMSGDYETAPGSKSQKAVDLAVLLLDARRRIFSVMNKVFGSPQDIARQVDGQADPNDEEMILKFNLWASQGADPHNIAFFDLFLKIQKSLHAMMPAYFSNSSDFIGGDLPLEQQAKFQKFGQWLSEGLNEAASTNGYYLVDISQLKAELFATATSDKQPYFGTAVDAGQHVGWDVYSYGFNPNDPSINPLATDDSLSGQLQKIYYLTESYRNGEPEKYLGGSNWVVHALGELVKFSNKDVARIVTNNIFNGRKSEIYKEEMDDYNQRKEELAYEEARASVVKKKSRMKKAAYRKEEENKKKVTQAPKSNWAQKRLAYYKASGTKDTVQKRMAARNLAKAKSRIKPASTASNEQKKK